MKDIIKTLSKDKVFLFILLGLYVAGLCDLVSTIINIDILHIAYEANFYIPFLSTQIFTLVLIVNSLFLKGNWFIVSGCVVVLCSFIPFINNLNVYISV